MKRLFLLVTTSVLAVLTSTLHADAGEWRQLFDGRTLKGWKAAGDPSTFRVENGAIVVEGKPGYLYYAGDVMQHDFRNFELTAEVHTAPGSNSGIFFHVKYRADGEAPRGHEAQVNNSSPDPRKTGSLYAVRDVAVAPAEDGQWFRMNITVQGRRIVIAVDGRTVVDYTEPPGAAGIPGRGGRVISSGTFALQGHDEQSRVMYRNIKVRVLPDQVVDSR